MSLVGLLPPLCDNGNLLVDGGYRKYNDFFNMILKLMIPQSTTFRFVRLLDAKFLLITR